MLCPIRWEFRRGARFCWSHAAVAFNFRSGTDGSGAFTGTPFQDRAKSSCPACGSGSWASRRYLLLCRQYGLSFDESGFLFSSTLTEHCPSGAVGLPFDSGGCVRRYKLPVGIPPIDFVKAHEMPVPLCRSYLGDLLQTHFASREDYLSGQPYRCPECGVLIDDPHGFREVQPDQLVRQHEIRIPGRLPVTHPHLMAVFVPRTLTDPGPKNRLPYKMHGAANLYNGFTSPPKSDSWGITWNAYKAVQALKNTGSYLETLVN